MLGACGRAAPRKGSSPTQVEAFRLDADVSAVARGLGAFDLALGVTVAQLSSWNGPGRMGYVVTARSATSATG